MVGLSGEVFNACAAVVDRHCEADADRVALIARSHDNAGVEVRFGRLYEGVSRFAAVLDSLNVRRGDRVCVLLDPRPELYFSILGTVRVGAIAQPLFSAFGTEAIADRAADSGACVFVTSAPYIGKVRAALQDLPCVEHILVLGANDIDLGPRERDFAQMLDAASTERAPESTSPEDPMLLHYSSGTTGKPKGVLHVHEALVGHALTAEVVLDLKRQDQYWCTADPGWVTGTSYGIFGPWALGITQIAYSGGFSSAVWYEILQSGRVTVWYTSPTALRMLMRDGTAAVEPYDLTTLRHVCCVGEPLNPEVIRWAQEAYHHVVRDTWWQTETGCIQIANYPFMEVRPGSMGRPFAGVTAAILDPVSKVPVGPKQEGVLALKPPWPSMFREYWGKPEQYAAKFRNGWYLTGDRAYTDEDGYFWFIGRDDDVINTSGHLVGPFEVESSVLTHEAVVEAAAFGIPDEGAGEVVAVEVVLAPGHEVSRELTRDLKTLVRRQVGSYATPREVVAVDTLPRTRSGKIMRRVARAEFLGLPVGDVSALDADGR